MNKVSSAQITILDMKDAVTADTEPLNPEVGQLWIDTSNGSVLKRYTGTEWVNQTLNISDLDSAANAKLQEAYNSITDMANDGVITFIEKKTVLDNITKLIGTITATAALPTWDSMYANTALLGEIKQVHKEGSLLLGATHTKVEALKTAYNNLRTLINTMTNNYPYDTSKKTKIVLADYSTTVANWRSRWKVLYQAIAELRYEITVKQDLNIKDTNTLIVTKDTLIRSDLNLIGSLPEGLSMDDKGITALVNTGKYARLSTDGLSVVNGAISIRTGNEDSNIGMFIDATGLYANTGTEETVRIDTDGNAYFKGTIHATSGSFTGAIYASEGTFSGEITGGSININNNFIVDEYGNVTIRTGSISPQAIENLIVNPIHLEEIYGWETNEGSQHPVNLNDTVFDTNDVKALELSFFNELDASGATQPINTDGYIRSDIIEIDPNKMYGFLTNIKSDAFDYELEREKEESYNHETAVKTGNVEIYISIFNKDMEKIYVERYLVENGEIENPPEYNEDTDEFTYIIEDNYIFKQKGTREIRDWYEVGTFILPQGYDKSEIKNMTDKGTSILKLSNNAKYLQVVLHADNNVNLDGKNAGRTVSLTNARLNELYTGSLVKNKFAQVHDSVKLLEQRVTNESIIKIFSETSEGKEFISGSVAKELEGFDLSSYVKKHEVIENIDETINKFSINSNLNMVSNSNAYSYENTYWYDSEGMPFLDSYGADIERTKFIQWTDSVVPNSVFPELLRIGLTEENFDTTSKTILATISATTTPANSFTALGTSKQVKEEAEKTIGVDSSFYFSQGRYQSLYQDISVEKDKWYTISYKIRKKTSASGLSTDGEHITAAGAYAMYLGVFEKDSEYTTADSLKNINPYLAYDPELTTKVDIDEELLAVYENKFKEFDARVWRPANTSTGVVAGYNVGKINSFNVYDFALGTTTLDSNYTLISKLHHNRLFESSEYVTQTIHFKPSKNTVRLFMNSGYRTEGAITAITLNTGQEAMPWKLGTGELFNTNIKMDIEGISIFETNPVTGRPEGNLTKITKSEFSGFYNEDKVFYLKEDETYSKKFKTNEFSLGPINIIEAKSVSQPNLLRYGGLDVTYNATNGKQSTGTAITTYPMPGLETSFPKFRVWHPNSKNSGITVSTQTLSTSDIAVLGSGISKGMMLNCTNLLSSLGWAVDDVPVTRDTTYTMSMKVLVIGTPTTNAEILLSKGQGTTSSPYVHSQGLFLPNLKPATTISTYNTSGTNIGWKTVSHTFTTTSKERALNLYFGMTGRASTTASSAKIIVTGIKLERGSEATEYQNSVLDTVKGSSSFDGWVFVLGDS